MAYVAIDGSREYPEAIPCDVVGHDSINYFAGFPAQQLKLQGEWKWLHERAEEERAQLEHNELNSARTERRREWRKSNREIPEVGTGMNGPGKTGARYKVCEYESF